MSKESKKTTKEIRDNGPHTQKAPKTGGESITASESIKNPMGQWIRDLEIIFEKAMQEEKLNIALKAKELLARNKGWITGIAGGVASTPLSIKSIDQWTLQEINSLISQLDAYGDLGCGNDGAPDGDPDPTPQGNDSDPDGDLDGDPDPTP